MARLLCDAAHLPPQPFFSVTILTNHLVSYNANLRVVHFFSETGSGAFRGD